MNARNLHAIKAVRIFLVHTHVRVDVDSEKRVLWRLIEGAVVSQGFQMKNLIILLSHQFVRLVNLFFKDQMASPFY